MNAPGAFALIVGQVQATAPRVTCQVIERQFGFTCEPKRATQGGMMTRLILLLELISEMVSEQNPNACQMHKADVVFNLILIAHCNPAMAQQPAVQAFNLPSPLVSPQRPTVLRFRRVRLLRCGAIISMPRLANAASKVIRLVTNQTFGFIRHKISVAQRAGIHATKHSICEWR